MNANIKSLSGTPETVCALCSVVFHSLRLQDSSLPGFSAFSCCSWGVGWHHRLNGHECEQAPGVGDGHRSLACCSPRGRKELDTTERLNNDNVHSTIKNKTRTIYLVCVLSHSVVSDSLWPHGLQSTGHLCSRDFPGKNTGVDCHFLVQGIFLIQESNPRLWHTDSLPLSHLGSPQEELRRLSMKVKEESEKVVLKLNIHHPSHLPPHPIPQGPLNLYTSCHPSKLLFFKLLIPITRMIFSSLFTTFGITSSTI